MIQKIKRFGVLPIFLGLSFLLLLGMSVRTFAGANGVEYQTHIQNEGWGEYVTDGMTSGTTGRALRMEGLKLRLKDPSNLSIEYRAHVENIGWQDYVGEDQLAGTVGRALRLEALSIRLTGDESENYDIYYRVHGEDYGWQNWVKNGDIAGTTGMGKRVEAIEISLRPKTEEYGSGMAEPNAATPLHYRTYVQGTGWNDWTDNGGQNGSGDNRTLEAMQFGLSEENYKSGGIIYRLFGTSGWTPWVSNDGVAGQAGDMKQAIRIKLTSKLPYLYDIYYRVHVPNVGWSNWAKNGEACGSEGYNRGISLIQVVLTSKGNAPGPVGNAFLQGPWQWPVPGRTSISSGFGPRNGSHHDGIDIPAPEGTPIVAVKSGTVRSAGPNGNFGNCVCVENDSGEFVYYAHMVRVATNAGAHVARGQVIGYVGNTGNSRGNHLHLEVYDSATNLVTPLNYY